jgi:two-component system nitrogen regulation response regulator GlnG
MPNLLIVDDEPNVLYSLEKSLRSETLQVTTATTAKQAIDLVRRQPTDAVILDVRLPDMSGLEAFDHLRQIDPHLPVIIVTAYATTETAIEAMKRGAFEYLLKPVDFHQLREVVARALELSRLRHVPALFEEEELADVAQSSSQPGDRAVDRIVGRSPAMQEVYKAIGRAAPLDIPVLIVGESGTGKELVARAIYQHSRRSQGPFLALNCAAIPESLLESELFGHERGAFTGADRRRIGKFEQANGGTIFLDEISDLSSASQPKVLRVLQEQQFERVGGNETIQTDVRVVAASNRNLEELVAAGRFRPDLFYRLQVVTITLPPLRERKEDLALLMAHFLNLLNHSLGKHVTSVSPEAMRLLDAYRWPGNVRELQSALKYALVQSTGEVLAPDFLPEQFRGEGPAPSPSPPTLPTLPTLPSVAQPETGTFDVAQVVAGLLRAGESDIYRKVCAGVDRVIIETVLRHVKGSQVQASELLGISRTTLRGKLRSLGLAIEKQLLTESDQAEQ